MDLELARFLTTEAGAELLAAARGVRELPPHQRRRPLEGEASPARIRAALAQDDLRQKAGLLWPEADRLLFVREGLEQATAWPVAAERAACWPPPASAPLADLGSGLGADALATALTGRPVRAWEEDPVRALLLRHNALALGVGDRLEVHAGDFLADRPGGPLAFLDPDRRPGGRRTRAPQDFRPPADTWEALLAPFEGSMVKLPPVVDGADLPEGPLELVSLGGRLRERRLFLGTLAEGRAPRAALALPLGERVEGTGQPWPAAVEATTGAWLLDPDASVTVAGLVGDLAQREGLAPIHPRIAYLLGSAPASAPGHWMQIAALLPARAAAINRWLDAEDIGQLTIRSRGLADSVEQWRKRLRPRGTQAATVVLTRDARERWVAYAGREHSGAMTEK